MRAAHAGSAPTSVATTSKILESGGPTVEIDARKNNNDCGSNARVGDGSAAEDRAKRTCMRPPLRFSVRRSSTRETYVVKPQTIALQSVAITFTFPETSANEKHIRRLLVLENRRKMPTGAHIVRGEVGERDSAYYANVHIDRRSGEFWCELVLLPVGVDEAPRSRPKNLGLLDVWRMCGSLSANQEAFVTSIANYDGSRPIDDDLRSKLLQVGDRTLRLTGVEYQADPDAKGGVVRVGWFQLPSNSTIVDFSYFATIDAGRDPWQQHQQLCEQHMRQIGAWR